MADLPLASFKVLQEKRSIASIINKEIFQSMYPSFDIFWVLFALNFSFLSVSVGIDKLNAAICLEKPAVDEQMAVVDNKDDDRDSRLNSCSLPLTVGFFSGVPVIQPPSFTTASAITKCSSACSRSFLVAHRTMPFTSTAKFSCATNRHWTLGARQPAPETISRDNADRWQTWFPRSAV